MTFQKSLLLTIPPLSKSESFKPVAITCCCTAWFVSDLVGKLEDRFSHNEAHIGTEERNSQLLRNVVERTDDGSCELMSI